MASVSSCEGPPGFRTARCRTDVMVCAVVSAMPPKIALEIIIVRTTYCQHRSRGQSIRDLLGREL